MTSHTLGASSGASVSDAIAEAVEMVHISRKRAELAPESDRQAYAIVAELWAVELAHLERIERLRAFDPYAWFDDWREAGGSFASIEGRLILGVIVGDGADHRRLAQLVAVLASNDDAKQAVASALAQPMEAAHG